jgi:hypothetical protein
MMAALLLAGVSLAATAAHGQSVLRGAVDDDPIQRVGRTASEANRNVVRPTAPRIDAAAAQRQAARRRARTRTPAGTTDQPSAAQSAAGLQSIGIQPVITPEPAAVPPPRPRLQNFRSLERPANTAVPLPAGDQAVNQGLATPVPPPRRAISQANPYDPIGLRLGSGLVFPTIDAAIGYDSNPESRNSGQRKKGAVFARTEASLIGRSDLPTNEVTVDLRGGYSKFFGVDGVDRPDAQGRIGLRLDYTRDTAFDFELRGRIDTETPGTVNLVGGTQERPLTFQSGATAGVTQRFNRLAVSARATIDRSNFSDTTLAGGVTLSQQDRNFTQYGLRLRTAYEVTPGFVPFTEVLVDTRKRDQAVDNAGFRRDSDGLQVRVGTSFEITRTLTGEVLAGYGLRRSEDPRLRELRGPVAEGTLAWSVTPLTTVRLRGATEFEETTQAGSTGAITRRITAEVSHALLRNLNLTAAANFARADFNGINRQEDTTRASLGFDYSLTPNVVFRGSYINARTISSQPGNSISSNIFLFGARLQF